MNTSMNLLLLSGIHTFKKKNANVPTGKSFLYKSLWWHYYIKQIFEMQYIPSYSYAFNQNINLTLNCSVKHLGRRGKEHVYFNWSV